MQEDDRPQPFPRLVGRDVGVGMAGVEVEAEHLGRRQVRDRGEAPRDRVGLDFAGQAHRDRPNSPGPGPIHAGDQAGEDRSPELDPVDLG